MEGTAQEGIRKRRTRNQRLSRAVVKYSGCGMSQKRLQVINSKARPTRSEQAIQQEQDRFRQGGCSADGS